MTIQLSRYDPRCIKHFPGAVLDVLLSTSARGARADPPSTDSSQAFNSFISEFLSSASINYPQSSARKLPKAVSDLAVTLEPLAVFESVKLRHVTDKSTPIQSRGETARLIPQLFVVLPEQPIKYDSTNWHRTKFCLHLICECGRHTMTPGSEIPHHPHLVKHEGYVVSEPIELFKIYGPFLLLMLESIKLGASISGYTIPPLSSLRVVELSDSVELPAETVSAMIDYSLECIKDQMRTYQATSPDDMDDPYHRKSTLQELTNYMSNVNGAGGIGLVELSSLLLTQKDTHSREALQRLLTSDGGVKWICRDHYNSYHRGLHTQKLRGIIKSSGGVFDEQLSKVDIILLSTDAADVFYVSLRRSKCVLDLTVHLNWSCTWTAIDALRHAVRKSLITTLNVDLRSSSITEQGFHRLLGQANLRIVHIVLPNNFLIPDFMQTRPLQLDWLSAEKVVAVRAKDKEELRLFAEIPKTDLVSGPVRLYLWDKSVRQNGAQALAEDIKTNLALDTFESWDEAIQGARRFINEVLRASSTPASLGLRLKAKAIKKKNDQFIFEAPKIESTLPSPYLRVKTLEPSSNPTTMSLWGLTIEERQARTLSGFLKYNPMLTLNLCRNIIKYGGTEILFRDLSTNKTLTTLNLWSCSIEFNGLEKLYEAIKINSTLISLDLGNNSIGELSATMLFEALKVNAGITTLALSNNSIGHVGAANLSEALKTNANLAILDLTYNSFGDAGVRVLSQALEVNKSLTTLILKSNSIREGGAQALSEALEANETLTTLDLGGNKIKDEGAQALSHALMANSTLTTLDLQSNSIGNPGSSALFRALADNATLTHLDLNSNWVGDMGAIVLSAALEINSTLTFLSLGSNTIGNRGAEALSEALLSNSTLTVLYFEYNKIGEDGAIALSEAHYSRSTLTIHYYSVFRGREKPKDANLLWRFKPVPRRGFFL